MAKVSVENSVKYPVSDVNFEIDGGKEDFKVSEEVVDILVALRTNSTYIDDHNGESRTLGRASSGIAFVKTRNGVKVCPIYETYQCLNGLYMEDGAVHLSTWSVGGDVDCRKGLRAGLEYALEKNFILGYMVGADVK